MSSKDFSSRAAAKRAALLEIIQGSVAAAKREALPEIMQGGLTPAFAASGALVLLFASIVKIFAPLQNRAIHVFPCAGGGFRA